MRSSDRVSMSNLKNRERDSQDRERTPTVDLKPTTEEGMRPKITSAALLTLRRAFPAPTMTSSMCTILALLLTLSLLPQSAIAATDPVDLAALMAFKAALATPANLQWPDVTAAGADPCGTPVWQGLQCVPSLYSQYQVVNSLQIMDTPLGGTLSPVIANLTAVRSIFLGNTGLGGAIPNTLSRMGTLELLGLDRNNFTSLLPGTFSTMTQLSRLYLLSNPLQGAPPVPDLAPLTRLDTLDLTSCGFGGTIPSYLGALTGLTYLGLAGNYFTGPIPPSLANGGMSNLVRLTLSNNNLNGSIPEGFSALSSLQMLSLSWNQLSGNISPSLAALSSLTALQMEHNNLLGQLPPELGTLLPPKGNLAAFSVAANNLVGPIPKFMAAFKPISWSENGFCSQVPGVPCNAEVQALLDFQGGVGYPSTLSASWQGASACPNGAARPWKGVLCSKGKVVALILPKEGLRGQVSPSLSLLPSLSTLQLQNNTLTGAFPATVAAMPSLQKVDIQNNKFTGPPPKFAASVQADYTCNAFVPAVPCGPTAPPPAVLPLPVEVPPEPANTPPPSGNVPSGSGVDSENRTAPPGAAPGVPSGSTSNNTVGAPAPAPGGQESGAEAGAGSASGMPPGAGSASGSTARVAAIAGAAVGVVALLGLVACLLLWWRRRRAKVAQEQSLLITAKALPSHASGGSTMTGGSMAAAPVPGTLSRRGTFHSSMGEGRTSVAAEEGSCMLGVEELRAATLNFAEERNIGKGGFATVYRGTLPGGREVAVKRMEVLQMPGKGMAEYQAEVSVLTGVRHRHLVSLLGYVAEGRERLLVYELMTQGPLSHHLFNPSKRGLRPLTWQTRLTIALDVAKGVEYLHHLAHKSFIHRDLKPSNILLDNHYRAKVADFGLVKPTDIVDNFASVETRLAGTFGYLAPEYAATGKVTVMSDVYSYGVILMELITGRRALDDTQPEARVQLVRWVSPQVGDPEKLFRVIDPVLCEEIDGTEGAAFRTVQEVASLALHCVARDPRRRPNMSTVVAVLTPLAAKWQPTPTEEEENDDGVGASLAAEVEKWQEEEDDPEGREGMDSMVMDESGFMYHQSHQSYSRGEGMSKMAEHYSMDPRRVPGVGPSPESNEDRQTQSFAGHSQGEMSTSMRNAVIEPR